MFSSASTMNYTVKHKGYRGYKGQCEYFAVYVEELRKVYLISVDKVGISHAAPDTIKEQPGEKCTVGKGLGIIDSQISRALRLTQVY